MIAVFPSFYLSSLAKRNVNLHDAVTTNDPHVMLKEHDVKVYDEINSRFIPVILSNSYDEITSTLNKMKRPLLQYRGSYSLKDAKLDYDLNFYMKVTELSVLSSAIDPKLLGCVEHRPFYVISLSDFEEEGYVKITEENISNLRTEILLDNMELAQAWPLLYRQIACSR